MAKANQTIRIVNAWLKERGLDITLQKAEAIEFRVEDSWGTSVLR